MKIKQQILLLIRFAFALLSVILCLEFHPAGFYVMSAIAALFVLYRSQSQEIPKKINKIKNGQTWLIASFGLIFIGDVSIEYTLWDANVFNRMVSDTFAKCLAFQTSQLNEDRLSQIRYSYFTVLSPYAPPAVAIVLNLHLQEIIETVETKSINATDLAKAITLCVAAFGGGYFFFTQSRTCSILDSRYEPWIADFIYSNKNQLLLHNYLIPFMSCFIFVIFIVILASVDKFVKTSRSE